MGRGAGRELDAAGITEPALRASYTTCRQLNAEHGRTYYLATLLLPPPKRPYVHALYGFARYADDIVDDLDPAVPAVVRAERLLAWSDAFLLDVEAGRSTDQVAAAVIDTIARWGLPTRLFADFLRSMRADLTVTEYETYDDLGDYMWGSAAVIGLQMLPILGRADPGTQWAELEPYAIDLGIAFQLTNFIRDVADDLDRGRIYLPQDSLRQFGVDRERLERGRVDEPIRRWLAYEIDRTRKAYGRAAPGIELVHPTSQDCLRTAMTLYSNILCAVERADYDVFAGRARVSRRLRAGVGARGLLRAWQARRRYPVDRETPTSTA